MSYINLEKSLLLFLSSSFVLSLIVIAFQSLWLWKALVTLCFLIASAMIIYYVFMKNKNYSLLLLSVLVSFLFLNSGLLSAGLDRASQAYPQDFIFLSYAYALLFYIILFLLMLRAESYEIVFFRELTKSIINDSPIKWKTLQFQCSLLYSFASLLLAFGFFSGGLGFKELAYTGRLPLWFALSELLKPVSLSLFGLFVASGYKKNALYVSSAFVSTTLYFIFSLTFGRASLIDFGCMILVGFLIERKMSNLPSAPCDSYRLPQRVGELHRRSNIFKSMKTPKILLFTLAFVLVLIGSIFALYARALRDSDPLLYYLMDIKNFAPYAFYGFVSDPFGSIEMALRLQADNQEIYLRSFSLGSLLQLMHADPVRINLDFRDFIGSFFNSLPLVDKSGLFLDEDLISVSGLQLFGGDDINVNALMISYFSFGYLGVVFGPLAIYLVVFLFAGLTTALASRKALFSTLLQLSFFVITIRILFFSLFEGNTTSLYRPLVLSSVLTLFAFLASSLVVGPKRK